jgi:hypothetical protein
LQQVLHQSQAVTEIVSKGPMIGMANLNEQLGALRFQQPGEEFKFLAFQVQGLMSRWVHENLLGAAARAANAGGPASI